jgi:hypothetical protein
MLLDPNDLRLPLCTCRNRGASSPGTSKPIRTNPVSFLLFPRSTTRTLATLISLVVSSAVLAAAAELKQETVSAWNSYVQQVQSTLAARGTGGTPFLWVDESPDRKQSVLSGELLASPQAQHSVPHGLIHHWIGAMFIPGVTLDDVRRVLADYKRYPDFYRPMVVSSKLIERTDDYERATLVMTQKAFSVTAAAQVEEEVHVTTLGPNRIDVVSHSVHVQEIENYGAANEHLFPEGQGPGYVWRTMGITRVEQRDGGAYVEVEMIDLSRNIPALFRWMVKPLTQKVSRGIVLDVLKDTEAAVRQQAPAADPARVPKKSAAVSRACRQPAAGCS